MEEEITLGTDRLNGRYLAFLDGDTLAAVLPEDPDYAYFARLIFVQLEQAQTSRAVRTLLVDCLLLSGTAWHPLEDLDDLTNLGRSLQRLGIEFVLLDAPIQFRIYLSTLAPGARCIESPAGHPLGNYQQPLGT